MNKEELDEKVTALVAMTYKHAYKLGQANPSEETITKIVRLSQQYAVDRLKNGNAFPNEKDRIKYIKQHWNDE